jgi:GWxTD domain-containing protein
MLIMPFLALLVWWGSSWATDGGALPFFVDTAVFQSLDDNTRSYVEMYILLSSKSLEFREEGEEYGARLSIEASVVDSAGEQKWSRQWRKEILVSSEEGLERGSSILDIAGLMVEPAFYTLKIDLRDELSGNTGSVTGELYVPAFPADTLSISQVEMALEITASQEEGDFVKNGLQILPNPTRIYGYKAPILYSYVEIYDLRMGAGFDSTYTIQQKIYNTSNELVKEYEPKTQRKPGRTCVEVGGINVLGLEPETYIYRIVVRDNANDAEVYSQRWFQVSSPAGDVQASSFESVALTPEAAEQQGNLIKYIANKRELQTYQDLGLEGKTRFLEEFWQRRDPDPTAFGNEFREEHTRRWNFANQQFSKFKQGDGWKSDRGRVYIIYGPPDDIERHPSDFSSVAWEQWFYYSLEGGVHFVFADLSGFDNFVLLHSNARNELRDWGWQEKLFPGQ